MSDAAHHITRLGCFTTSAVLHDRSRSSSGRETHKERTRRFKLGSHETKLHLAPHLVAEFDHSGESAALTERLLLLLPRRVCLMFAGEQRVCVGISSREPPLEYQTLFPSSSQSHSCIFHKAPPEAERPKRKHCVVVETVRRPPGERQTGRWPSERALPLTTAAWRRSVPQLHRAQTSLYVLYLTCTSVGIQSERSSQQGAQQIPSCKFNSTSL